MEEINSVLNKIKQTKNFPEYKEFFLTKTYNLNGNKELKNIINNGNLENNNTDFMYNKRTHVFNIIGVIDIENKRYIDFDDDWYTMTNKGIDNQTAEFLN